MPEAAFLLSITSGHSLAVSSELIANMNQWQVPGSPVVELNGVSGR